ncbi:MAG TPA: hypothetical protein VJ728_11125, partial [Candidatus Binataceae bacterium]|nr:hypothetical protein [Candidatus Binataceae bacterium]
MFSPAEIKLFDSINRGQPADYRTPSTEQPPLPTAPWSDDRTVSADTIHAILSDSIPAVSPGKVGIRILGARIIGDLQLSSFQIGYPLE